MPDHPPSAISNPSSCDVSAARLPHPVRLTEQTWPEGTVPVVTIRCITYQHVNCIRDAIEGFLMQETTFPVEIIINDDASTDGTAEIVKEYAEKHPQLFRTILQKENQCSKGSEAIARLREQINNMMRGEFIALCEGDDYWTSPQKLQKQVDCLEENPDLVISHHVVSYINSESGDLVQTFPPVERRLPVARGTDLVWSNFIQTCSILYRRSALNGIDVSNILKGLALGDWPLCALLCQRGDIGFCQINMAVYRIHTGNYWYHLEPKVKDAKVEVMSLRLAQRLEHRHALPWFGKIAQVELSEFYRTCFQGDLAAYVLASWRLIRRSASIRGSFVVHSVALSVWYSLLCIREIAKRYVAR